MAHRGKLIDVDLEEQIAALRKEIGSLAKAVSRSGSGFYGNAGERISDYVSDLSEYMPSMHTLRGGARRAGRMAYDHPAVVATVGLVVVGLVASLLLSSRYQPVRRHSARAEDGEGEARPAAATRARKRS